MNYIIGAFKPACNISVNIFGWKISKAGGIEEGEWSNSNGPTLSKSRKHIWEDFCRTSFREEGGTQRNKKMYFDRGNFYDFTSLVRELDVPGEIYERKTFPFEFSTVEMPYETYNGVNVRLSRGYAGSIVEYQDFVVRNYSPPPSINNSIKMEVGIEDCLHIEFEYNKSKYHLKDVIIGKIYFLLVRIKIKKHGS
ncbi:hypothetical protein Pfo_027910 [Paulownia fortunei]|nr:hypothetical protein Pfo_027910 [Paulownia fortunei]